jgi:polysaccharide pyruvyl transferase WcaK-like protein
VLITDAILFDHRLWNPMHNYLSSLALLIPQAKQRGLPIALYNASVGPIHTPAGRWCLTRVLRHSDLLILRDEDSLDHLAGSQPISARIERGADSALSAAVADPEQVAQILARHGISSDARTRIGININCYGDTYVRARSSSDFTQERLLSTLASTAEWIQGELGADVWLIGTQHMDLDILRNLRRRIGSGRIPLFTNRELGYAQIAGLLAQLDLLIGMRTHSLILASSVGTPVLGIVAYPKTYGYLERIGLEKQTIGVRELELDALRALIRRSWEQRATLRRDIRDAVERERKLASAAPAFLAPYLQR